jgi:hypothetical protein
MDPAARLARGFTGRAAGWAIIIRPRLRLAVRQLGKHSQGENFEIRFCALGGVVIADGEFSQNQAHWTNG